ncbi:hypothetical protein H6P81_001514 [Aristolochia fimbriata]|uniref:AP2/ERF domain-containing protein n=1 Tax=Aristolochia fimbriata TaxID=158543 RepID=A0AAV7FAZ8_ARIFI|nr:hypothetical protein H6P81_001514 [Aristolochia fimbriata]
MESQSEAGSLKKYVGVRRRRWGKWVSEIRVRGTRSRLWLGTYSTAEAAAVAHDTAAYYLEGGSSTTKLNFPTCVPTFLSRDMSPKSIQEAASRAGTCVDAKLARKFPAAMTGGAVGSAGEDEARSTVPNFGIDIGNYEMGREEQSISVDDLARIL